MSAGSGHQPLKIALIVLTLLALLVIFVINGLSSSSDNRKLVNAYLLFLNFCLFPDKHSWPTTLTLYFLRESK